MGINGVIVRYPRSTVACPSAMADAESPVKYPPNIPISPWRYLLGAHPQVQYHWELRSLLPQPSAATTVSHEASKVPSTSCWASRPPQWRLKSPRALWHMEESTLTLREALMQYYLCLMFYRLLAKYLFWFLLKALLPACTLPLPLPAFCDFLCVSCPRNQSWVPLGLPCYTELDIPSDD